MRIPVVMGFNIGNTLPRVGSTVACRRPPRKVPGPPGAAIATRCSCLSSSSRSPSCGCKLGANPDQRCSPGAYYSKLTTPVICSSSFRTSTIRNVPDSEKHQVEIEYGLTPKGYGSTLEIDHIVSLELGRLE